MLLKMADWDANGWLEGFGFALVSHSVRIGFVFDSHNIKKGGRKLGA